MLAFARRQPLQPSPVHLGQMCRNVAKLLGRTLGERIRIDIKCERSAVARARGSGAGRILADQSRRERARRDDRRRHADHRDPQHRRRTARTTTFPPGISCCCRSTDTGVGMTAEVLERAVEPFFTTKNLGPRHRARPEHGVRLRQAVGRARQDRERAESRHARAAVSAADRRGRLSLRTSATETEAAEISGRDRTILLVEDDAGVRAVTAAMLKELQFTVIEADNGSHALDIVDRQPDIDLLFTDIVMPGHEWLRARPPGARDAGRSCRCSTRPATRRHTRRRRRAPMCWRSRIGKRIC